MGLPDDETTYHEWPSVSRCQVLGLRKRGGRWDPRPDTFFSRAVKSGSRWAARRGILDDEWSVWR